MLSRLGRDFARNLILGVLKQSWELNIGGSGADIEYGVSGLTSVWQEVAVVVTNVVEEDGKESWVGDDATDIASEDEAENEIGMLLLVEIFSSFFSTFNFSFLSCPNFFFQSLTSNLKPFVISAISICFLLRISFSSMFSFLEIFFWVLLFASASLIWSARSLTCFSSDSFSFLTLMISLLKVSSCKVICSSFYSLI